MQAHLANHEVRRTYQLGWAEKTNGELLELAEAAGYDLLVTADQNVLHQQRLGSRKIAVFILGRGNWPEIKPHAEKTAAQIKAVKAPGIYVFEIKTQ